VRYTPPAPLLYLALGSCPAVRYPTARRRSDAPVDPIDLAALDAGATSRPKARRLGVSHEAVRRAMIAAGVPTDLEGRNARIREMAARGVPWPGIARAFGLSPSAVRRVYWDLPPRPSGPKRREGRAAAVHAQPGARYSVGSTRTTTESVRLIAQTTPSPTTTP
jgi:hypothetical protein